MFDVTNLAAGKTSNNLDVSVTEALPHGSHHCEGVFKGSLHETLETSSSSRLVEAGLGRLVAGDENDVVKGTVPLPDILRAQCSQEERSPELGKGSGSTRGYAPLPVCPKF